MGFSQNLKQFILLVFFLNLMITPESSADHTNLVYKGCADQKFQDPTGIYSQNLNTLFSELISQSSSVRFYKTTAGEGGSAITGVLQCREDLSNSDCNRCVKQIPGMSQKLCGGNVMAARVQLEGCYLRYEAAGFRQANSTELLYKICGSTQASGAGFQERLNSAFGEIAKGVGGEGNGFYAGDYQSVNVLGQCEGDLGGGDCVDCVQTAAQKATSECGAAISANIFLHECYISYSYDPNGVRIKSLTSSGKGQTTQKTVAIVLGGIVGIGMVFACLLYAKSAFKKRRLILK